LSAISLRRVDPPVSRPWEQAWLELPIMTRITRMREPGFIASL
jgi:hypothetical protein